MEQLTNRNTRNQDVEERTLPFNFFPHFVIDEKVLTKPAISDEIFLTKWVFLIKMKMKSLKTFSYPNKHPRYYKFSPALHNQCWLYSRNKRSKIPWKFINSVFFCAVPDKFISLKKREFYPLFTSWLLVMMRIKRDRM